MPFREKTFNLINSGGVLEHFENPQGVLQEYFRVTKPNGVIIVSVPNLVGRNARLGIKPLRELVFGKGRKGRLIERNFSGTELRRIIEESGFRCMNISPTLFNIFDFFPFNYLRFGLYRLRLYSHCCRCLNVFGRRFPGFAFGYSFMIALARRPEA